MSAAFDTLNHHQLLFVLKNDNGLCDNVLKWFYSYLSSRTFSVVAAGSRSSVYNLCIGVPQGSILGPLLFILFTKGLEDVVHAHNIQFYSYADDSQLLFNVHPPPHQCSAQSQLLQLQNCLSDVNNWMSNHFLKLNVDKTEVMEVNIYPNLLPKVFHNFSLLFDQNACLNFSTVKHVKNLGFVFDDSLNLTSQINQIVKTCYHRLNNLYRIGSMLSKDRKLQLVTVYIFSCLDNCNILYYGISAKLLSRLQVVLNDCIRFVCNVRRSSWKDGVSITNLAKELHVLPVRNRILYKISLTVFKCLHGIAPSYLKDLIMVSQPYCGLRTTNRINRLEPPSPPKYNKMTNAFKYCAPTVWNDLPSSIRFILTLASFKSSLKAHYFRIAYHTV